MKHLVPFLSVLPVLLLAAGIGILDPEKAVAASSEWAQTAGGRMRLVALPPEQDGTVPAILQIELDKGWKTYWREPGAAGIPPHVTLRDGGNVTFSGLRFPAPMIFDDGKIRDYGYEERVSLLLKTQRIAPGLPVELSADVFLGLCETICVPFQASLSVTVRDGDPIDASEAALIAQARLNLPDGPTDDLQIVTATLSDDGQGVRLTAQVPDETQAKAANLLLTNEDGLSFEADGPPSVTGTSIKAHFRLRHAPAGFSLKGKPVMVLVNTGTRVMETTLAFE